MRPLLKTALDLLKYTSFPKLSRLGSSRDRIDRIEPSRSIDRIGVKPFQVPPSEFESVRIVRINRNSTILAITIERMSEAERVPYFPTFFVKDPLELLLGLHP